jgi:hypothetical protein
MWISTCIFPISKISKGEANASPFFIGIPQIGNDRSVVPGDCHGPVGPRNDSVVGTFPHKNKALNENLCPVACSKKDTCIFMANMV